MKPRNKPCRLCFLAVGSFLFSIECWFLPSRLIPQSFSLGDSPLSDESGFRPIFVYHGPHKSIESLNKQTRNKHSVGSQVGQDIIVNAITNELSRSPSHSIFFFVDLAANDATHLSNTYRLEKEGWHGLCIEPNPIYWYRLAYRKCDIAATFVGGKVDGTEVDVYMGNEAEGGIVAENMDNKPRTGLRAQKRYTISTDTMFRRFHVPKTIDYMSLDAEGAEELIMEDFPFKKYKINILTVERPSLRLESLLNANGYTLVAVLGYFGETLWVHRSVLQTLSVARIQSIVNTQHFQKEPKKGEVYFNFETREWRSYD